MDVVVAGRWFQLRPTGVVIPLTAVHTLTGTKVEVDNPTNVAVAMAITTRVPTSPEITKRAFSAPFPFILVDGPTGSPDHARGQRIAESLRNSATAQEIAVLVLNHDERIAQQVDHRHEIKGGALTDVVHHSLRTPRPSLDARTVR